MKAEILFLIHEGGRQYKVTNGKLISNIKGIYSYIFDLETKKLSGKKYAIAGPKFFKYKDEWLNDIRHRLGVAILADMYKHEVVCVQYYGKYKPVLPEMKDSNDIQTERTLFSVPETNYLNYMLNRAEYSNGKDLRNKYIH